MISIVIPTYNEEDYIVPTLISLNKQVGASEFQVIVADGGSTDNTISKVKEIQDRLDYKIDFVKGGSAAEGRNAGAKYASSDVILFLDADTTIDSESTILESASHIYNNEFDLVTCKIRSRGDLLSKIAFRLFECVHSMMREPFSTGVFFMTNKTKFNELGGFDESLAHTEDYILSRKYNIDKFKIMSMTVTQDDRRFKKMGYIKFLHMLLNNYMNRNNIQHFRKDIGYW